MAVFAPKVQFSQSADCATVTITDISNYLDGNIVDDANNTVRTVTINDSNGTEIDVIDILSTGTTDYTIATDQVLTAILTIVNLGNTYQDECDYLSTCFVDQCLAELASENECKDTCNDKDELWSKIFKNKTAAEYFIKYDNLPYSQDLIDRATQLCADNT